MGCTAFAADLIGWGRNGTTILHRRVRDGGETPFDAEAGRPVYVGHSPAAIHPLFTLQNLYINPLLSILDHANAHRAPLEPIRGVYDDAPKHSVVLFLDSKIPPTDGMWDAILAAVQPLADRGYLTYWNADDASASAESSDGSAAAALDSQTTTTTSPVTGNGTLHIRPVTIVGTGSTPFPSILHASPNASRRHIFMDAPLLDLVPSTFGHSSPSTSTYDYDTSTSFSATAPLFHPSVALGDPLSLIFGTASLAQRRRIRALVDVADAKGLKSRFWGVKGLPVARRAVWRTLVKEGVGLLVVDEIAVAAAGWCGRLERGCWIGRMEEEEGRP